MYIVVAISSTFLGFYYKIAGTYSFVDGYCGGESYVMYKKELAVSFAWLICMWLVLELLWAGIVKLFKVIRRKTSPRSALSDSDNEGMEETQLMIFNK